MPSNDIIFNKAFLVVSMSIIIEIINNCTFIMLMAQTGPNTVLSGSTESCAFCVPMFPSVVYIIGLLITRSTCNRSRRKYVLLVVLINYTISSSIGFALQRHILSQFKSFLLIGLFSGMPPVAMLLRVVHVMSKNPGKEIWHTNIMALTIIAGVLLLTPVITTWGLFMLPWVGMTFYLAYFLCYYLLMKLENDVDPRVDAEKMKEENDLRTPLLII